MKTAEEIFKKISEIELKPETPERLAIIDVLENELDEDEIEAKYFDENKTPVERGALRAREWLDDMITDEEFYF
jgi:hypothetical protein